MAPISEWRLNLQPATYNGVGFKVDVNTRASGRRNANHEFPKRDIPYAEDMGRKSRKFTVTGYVIGSTYTSERDALINQLEKAGPGQLVLPTGMQSIGTGQVSVDTYSVSERRERGGIATFEMTFIEFGVNTSTISVPDTSGAVTQQVNSALGPTSLSTAQSFINTPIVPSGFMLSSDITALQ